MTSNLADDYNSLCLAIAKLFDKQEKSYGCFQVQKEGEFYALNIPSLPSFKFYQNPKSIIYRGYWRTASSLPKPTDTRTFPPDLWIKKKQKQVQVNPINKPLDSKPKAKQWIDLTGTRSSVKSSRSSKKQRIYEIVYRYNPAQEVMRVNQILAACLRDKINGELVEVPEEMFPLVLIGNPE